MRSPLSAHLMVALIAGCGASTPATAANPPAPQDDPPVETAETSALSCPEGLPEGTSQGIVIAMPSQVVIRPGERHGMCDVAAMVPVCGFTRISVLEVIDDPRGIRVRVVPEGDGEELTGSLGDCDPNPVEPPPDEDDPIDRSELEGVFSGGPFQHNLIDAVPLPLRDGLYRVTAQFGAHESNTVTVRVISDDGET